MSNFDHDAHLALTADRQVPSWQVPAPRRVKTPRPSEGNTLAIVASVVTFLAGTVGTSACLTLDVIPFAWLLVSLVALIGGGIAMSFVTVPTKD